MGDAKQVQALTKSIRDYKSFRQMAEYNISCLLTYITPPTVGWRENVAAAVADNGIESIIEVLKLHPKAYDMVKQATTALSGLAISRDNAGRVAANGGIETALVCMLQMGNDQIEVIDAGAKLMETVARFNPESIMQNSAAVQAMLQGVVHEKVPRVQIASAKVLDRIANDDRGLEMIVANGGIEALIAAIAPGKHTDEEMLRPIFRILERLARNPDYVRRIRDCKGVEALVAQLDMHSDNDYILRAGGRLLAKIADSDIEETIRRLNGNISDPVRQHLIGLLANLALQPENVEKIVKNGGIEAILKVFPLCNPATKAVALRALQRIADTGAANVDKIIAAGGLEIIVNAIRTANGDEEILKAATQALTSIVAAGLPQSQLVHAAGGVKAVLDAMIQNASKSGFTEAALDFIEKLCAVDFDRQLLVQLGAVDSIYAAMRANVDDPEVQAKGFVAFSGLMSGNDENSGKVAAAAITSHNDVVIIPDCLRSHAVNKNVVRFGIQMLARLLALNPQAGAVLGKIGALEAIIEAVYEQAKLEMLGLSRLSSDAAFVRAIKALLTTLVDSSNVRGLARALAGGDKTQILMRSAVFCFNPDFAQELIADKMPGALANSLKDAIDLDVKERAPLLVDHAVAIWSLAKTGLDAMNDLFDTQAVKNLITVAKSHAALDEAVIAAFRSLLVFAANQEFKPKLLEADLINSCVKAMRTNAQKPEVQVASIDPLALVALNEKCAGEICFQGGTRQTIKMMKDSSTAPEFEKAFTRGLVLLYRIASVDKADVKEQLRSQGAVACATIAMAAFPENDEILEFGARILALLMTAEDVAAAIDDVVRLTADLRSTKRPDQVLDPLGQKCATVGFLSLNPRNMEIMLTKNALNVVQQALKVSKSKPLSTKRENAVMNEFRAVGQIGSVLGASNAVIKELLAALAASEDETSLVEKVGVLQALKYLCDDKDALKMLLANGAVGAIMDLIKMNRSDERLLLAGLNALSALMNSDEGIRAVTKAGGPDLLLDVLRDDTENLDHRAAEAAIEGLTKLSKLSANANKLIEDGVVDTVTSTVAIQCEDSTDARPDLVGASAQLLTQLIEMDENVADLIVKKGAIKKLIEIAESSPDYLTNDECMQKIANLLEALAKFEDLRPKLRDMGAVELMMAAMNMNAGNETLETTGQRVLQKLVGGDANALKHTLAEYDRLLQRVKKKVDDKPGLERLNRAGVNLGNLMMVEGVVDAAGAARIVERALDTFQVVEKAPKKVGPIREQVLDTALQIIGKSTLIEGAMDTVPLDGVLNLLSRAIMDDSSPQLQIEALTALGKFLAEDERVLLSALQMGLAAKLDEVAKRTANPQVREAAEQALENIREKVLLRPELLLSAGNNDAALAAILSSIQDPTDLEALLKKIAASPNGIDALMRLALGELSGQLSPDLKMAILRGLGNAPKGVLNIPPKMLKDIFDLLKNPKVGAEEKAALMKLLTDMKITPEIAEIILKNRGLETLLDLLDNPESKNPDMLLAALGALAQMATNPLLAKQLASLEAPQTVADVMKALQGNKQIQVKGFDFLTNLGDALGGPRELNLNQDALQYLDGALGNLDPMARKRAEQLVSDLKNLYNGEMGPLVLSRFENMLEALRAAQHWKVIMDPKTGKPYYYNTVTGETTWKMPAELKAAENAMRALEELAARNPAEIDPEKLRAVIGIFADQTAEPLRIKGILKALAALANNEANRDAMVRNGVLQALIQALNNGAVDREFILAAIALLNQFAHHPEYKIQICKIGGIEALIQIMMRFMDDEEIVWRCEQCLANLAFHSELCTQKIMVSKGPNAVAHALKKHKESVPVNQHAMSLLSNLMYNSPENKQEIGDLLRDRIVAVLRRMYKNLDVFKQTGRCIGNIAGIDEHTKHVVNLHAVRSLVDAMDFHNDNNEVLQLGIDIIGNFALMDEEQYADDIRAGRMISVVSTIWHEGGAKKIVDTFGAAPDAKVVGSCIRTLMTLLADDVVRKHLIGMGVVQLIFTAMKKYDWDQDISEFCVDAIEVLSTSADGIEAIYECEGVSLLLQQMEMQIERLDYVQTVVQTLVNMSNLRDHNEALSTRVMVDLAQQGGIDTLILVVDKHFQDPNFVMITMRILALLVSLEEKQKMQRTLTVEGLSRDIATKGMRVILKCVTHHQENIQVLIAAFQLIGVLAFEEQNLKVIVQYGGITLIIKAIIRFPDKGPLVKRATQTLDNIATGSDEHSNIVKQARGKDVIEKLIETYETMKGPEAQDVVKACRAALLAMNKIKIQPKVNKFIIEASRTDPNTDTLKEHRTLLKTGETLTYWKNGTRKAAHLLVNENNFQIYWKVPGQKKIYAKIDLRNLTLVQRGTTQGHGKNSIPNHCFSLLSNEKKKNKPFCFECDNEEQRNAWASALEELRLAQKNNSKFLKL